MPLLFNFQCFSIIFVLTLPISFNLCSADQLQSWFNFPTRDSHFEAFVLTVKLSQGYGKRLTVGKIGNQEIASGIVPLLRMLKTL